MGRICVFMFCVMCLLGHPVRAFVLCPSYRRRAADAAAFRFLPSRAPRGQSRGPQLSTAADRWLRRGASERLQTAAVHVSQSKTTAVNVGLSELSKDASLQRLRKEVILTFDKQKYPFEEAVRVVLRIEEAQTLDSLHQVDKWYTEKNGNRVSAYQSKYLVCLLSLAPCHSLARSLSFSLPPPSDVHNYICLLYVSSPSPLPRM